ncbi:uncharacterized protein LOC129916840 [Episyrphus balteatus]|uniref:uncharacterized protein LOC129916840 n=1 Tax=Episyrphus balteatus TaxID=286459 RepID=UPI00248598A1|nr:uncharacterized protein LOC129916840 [Episyrphus balteatus]
MLLTPSQPHNSLNNISSKNNVKSNKNNKRLPLLKKSTSTAQKNLNNSKSKQTANGSQKVPKKSVLLEMKLQKTLRKNAEEKVYSNKDHEKNLLQTKEMLANILKEYEDISKDKIILAAEIKNMKKYLAEIRLKLDQSLLVLNKNTTLFAMKKGMAAKYFTSGSKKTNGSKIKFSKKSKKNNVERIEPILHSILINSN